MSLPRVEVFQPQTVEEAFATMGKYPAEDTAILAGGTDILVNIKRPIIPAHLPRCSGCSPRTGKPIAAVENPPKYLIALSRIDGLKGIWEEEGGSIFIGSMTTITEICKSKLIRNELTALADGGDNLGSPLVRNRGTIGGNICNARPAADLLVPAYALKGELELVSAAGKRIIAVEDFVKAPGKTTIGIGEILQGIRFKSIGKKGGSSAVKLANRKALEISLVNAASVIVLNDDGKISEVRIAMGAVGPTPIIAQKAMEYLVGKKPVKAEFVKAGQIAAAECRPITDHRGTAIYRVEMVKVLVRRTLERAAGRH